MPIIEIAKIQVRRGQENQGQVPQLAPGELAWAEDTQNLYIGKRISEGANSDANSRILTDKDLSGLLSTAFGFTQNANVSSTSTAYRFKNYLPFGNLGTTGTTYATTSLSFSTKLDNWVSLTDFAENGIWPPRTSNDITTVLQHAIGVVGDTPTRVGGGVVFQNGTTDGTGTFAYSPSPSIGPMAIKIPAGNWTISSPVLLPPFTTLIGEGAGMTVLTYSNIASSGFPMFKTVDSYGVPYEGVQLATIPATTQYMATAMGSNARNITIRNMTLSMPLTAPVTTATRNAIISLDNVSNVLFDSVNFGNVGAVASTTTNMGQIVGAQIRTTLAPIVDQTMGYSENIQFNNCWFNGLTAGILNTGTVNRLIVSNSKFTALSNGLQSYNFINPSIYDGVIINSRFENIGREAIILGLSSGTGQTTYFTSENNSYRNVGNNYNNEQTQITNVLNFYDRGGQSINDYFDRQHNPITSSVTNIHWLSSNISAKSGAVQRALIPVPVNTTTTTTSIVSFPMGAKTSMVKINYNLDNLNLSRKGEMIMNISTSGNVLYPDGWADVSDYHTYFEKRPDGSGADSHYVFSTDLLHSQPAIALNSIYAYVNGNVGNTISTGTSTLVITMNTQDFFTSTNFQPNNTQVVFNDTGTFADGTNVATLVNGTLSGYAGNILTLTLNKVINHLSSGTQVIFQNPPLITWSPSVLNTFYYNVAHDSGITNYNANYISSATITVNRDLNRTYPITSFSRTTQNNFDTYALRFYSTATLQIQPLDMISVTLFPSQFYNYVTLTCTNTDIHSAGITTFNYTVELLT